MSGITDMKAAFAAAAPDIKLHAVRMRYGANNFQIVEIDVDTNGVTTTITQQFPPGHGTHLMMQALADAAKALGATVTDDETPPAPTPPPAAPQGLMGDMAGAHAPVFTLVGDAEPIRPGLIDLRTGAPILHADGGDNDVAPITHKGEQYELAHDGAPQSLFF